MGGGRPAMFADISESRIARIQRIPINNRPRKLLPSLNPKQHDNRKDPNQDHRATANC